MTNGLLTGQGNPTAKEFARLCDEIRDYSRFSWVKCLSADHRPVEYCTFVGQHALTAVGIVSGLGDEDRDFAEDQSV